MLRTALVLIGKVGENADAGRGRQVQRRIGPELLRADRPRGQGRGEGEQGEPAEGGEGFHQA